MSLKAILDQLKALDLKDDEVNLVIVTERQRQGKPYFELKYVRTEPALQTRLRGIVVRTIREANAVAEYTFDCPEPEGHEVRGLDSGGTNFVQIAANLKGLNPELDTIEDEDELFRAKAYLIVLRDEEGARVVAFKTLPESWKMKKAKHLIPLLFREHQFIDLEEESVFNIANTVDVIFYEETLFILSKKDFERGLNFRDGMIAAANLIYEEATNLDLFLNLEILQKRVGTNLHYLRRISTMNNLGHFRDAGFRRKMKEIVELRKWGISFDNEHRIVITEETLDDILTLLQNKRLRSEITENDFDVEHAKPLPG